MQLRIGSAFYWPTAGQRVVVCSIRRVEHTFITDRSLAHYLREPPCDSASCYPHPERPGVHVLRTRHEEFEAGALVTERIESCEVQGVDWTTDFKTIYTLWEIKKEADLGSGDGSEAAGAAAEGIKPQHGGEPGARN